MEATLSHELFQKNVERWTLFDPQAASQLSHVDDSHLLFCETAQNEINLQTEVAGKPEYFHSQEGALQEAETWFKTLNLKGIQVLCLYGVGLGYTFDACKQWLEENHDRLLFFIEDDLAVIKRLLETSRGTDILNHPQVWLYSFELENSKALSLIAGHFILRHYIFSALPFYRTMRANEANETRIWLNYGKVQLDNLLSEFISLDGGYFKNFYKNIFLLPESYFGNKLFGQFEGMPAIICGAGPSLAKNFEVLKGLKNHALIFAGSTALNVLSAGGLQPHIAVGIDPNPPQFERILNNQAFQAPFLYRNRIYNDALRLVHGDKVYINGSIGYHIGRWFESNLGIDEKSIQEGHNVVNFTVSLAHQLGCNPIILVGVDLAYTDAESYSFDLPSHAIQDPKKAYKTKQHHETLISKKDIYGNQVYTLEKWILESHWLTQFAMEHPKIKMINCTEGGLGFLGVSNIALSEVSSKVLAKQYDFDGMVHSAIQKANLPSKATLDNIQVLFTELEDSLNKSLDFSITLTSYYGQLDQGDEEVLNAIDETVVLLQNEVAFIQILNTYDAAFMHYHNAFLIRCKIEKDPPKKTAALMRHRYGILQQIIRTNLHLLKHAKEFYADTVSISLEAASQEGQSEMPAAPHDTQIDAQAQRQQLFHSNGKLKAESYVLNGLLHGPTRHYDDQGQLLGQAHFKDGLKEGEEYLWYANGDIYSIQRFHDNKPEGLQEYYYEGGVPRGTYYYIDGLLDGVNTLYYPNGKVKREMQYKHGQRHGHDLLWNEAGLLYIACEYVDDKPMGFARKWYSNGNLELEIDYHEPQNPTIKRWNENGIPIAPDKKGEDYFDRVTKETGVLTDAFTKIFAGIQRLSSFATDEQIAELKEIEKTITHMQMLYKELQKESGGIVNLTKEVIWKTQASEQQMKEYLQTVTYKMREDIFSIQRTIQDMSDRLLKKMEEQKKNDQNG